jgi:hypothetical protein
MLGGGGGFGSSGTEGITSGVGGSASFDTSGLSPGEIGLI